MSSITRTWLAFASLGAGLIHLALVLGSPVPIAIAAAGLGTAELGWGVLILVRGTLVVPRTALVVAIAPIVLWSLMIFAATLFHDSVLATSVEIFPLTISTLFELFAAGVLSVHLRRRADAAAPARPPTAPRYLAAVIVGGFAISVLTTPALAATEAGLYAQPHGEHSDSFVPQERDPVKLELPEHFEHP